MFAHVFSVLCWNLMCRAGNCVNIMLPHMSWCDDSLTISFAHTKTDQMGKKSKEVRHVYANPANPRICPILSLAIYLTCFPRSPGETRLFAGDVQYDRYCKILRRTLESQASTHTRASDNTHLIKRLIKTHHAPLHTPQDDALMSWGCVAKEFGTHSFRKGAATYVASGSTACPSHTSVCNRAGWTQGKVLDVYLQ